MMLGYDQWRDYYAYDRQVRREGDEVCYFCCVNEPVGWWRYTRLICNGCRERKEEAQAAEERGNDDT